MHRTASIILLLLTSALASPVPIPTPLELPTPESDGFAHARSSLQLQDPTPPSTLLQRNALVADTSATHEITITGIARRPTDCHAFLDAARLSCNALPIPGGCLSATQASHDACTSSQASPTTPHAYAFQFTHPAEADETPVPVRVQHVGMAWVGADGTAMTAEECGVIGGRAREACEREVPVEGVFGRKACVGVVGKRVKACEEAVGKEGVESFPLVIRFPYVA
ncbi:hypothetical protein HDU96_000905 [Phlyctochytrium bullatum]|nr:hypothetical protein HDU96_000905 [Phlyctochytrium bullatum]